VSKGGRAACAKNHHTVAGRRAANVTRQCSLRREPKEGVVRKSNGHETTAGCKEKGLGEGLRKKVLGAREAATRKCPR